MAHMAHAEPWTQNSWTPWRKHYWSTIVRDKPSTLYHTICRRSSILCDLIKWPIWDHGPQNPDNPKVPHPQYYNEELSKLYHGICRRSSILRIYRKWALTAHMWPWTPHFGPPLMVHHPTIIVSKFCQNPPRYVCMGSICYNCWQIEG